MITIIQLLYLHYESLRRNINNWRLFYEEFKEWSNLLFSEYLNRTNILMLSDLTIQELEFAKEEIRTKINELTQDKIISVGVNDEVIKLAESYINEGALTNKSYNDALHIAIATINNADVLASWNFKHIVNINRIRLYNSINLKHGYKMIEIRTPREILKSTEDGKE